MGNGWDCCLALELGLLLGAGVGLFSLGPL